MSTAPRSLRALPVLVAGLQFVYLLDCLAVLPLTPDLVRALGLPADRMPWLAAAYSAAAVVAGALGARWLDRWPRRTVLLIALAAFAAATAATAACSTMPQLLLTRAAAGLAGGPMIAIAMALVADSVPPAQRGRAMGRIMLGLPMAAIAGVPLALEAARHLGWQAPFLMVAGLAALLLAGAWACLPREARQRADRDETAPHAGLRSLLAQAAVRRALALQAGAQFCAFLLIPNFSTFFVLNLGVPREDLGLLYFAGGLAALVAMRASGRLTDSRGALLPLGLATVAITLGCLPLLGWQVGPPALMFVLFMAGNAARNVALSATASQAPAPHQRGRYMALQGLLQDTAITAATLLSGLLLDSAADGRLIGMPTVAALSITTAVGLAPLLVALRRELSSTDPARAAEAPGNPARQA
ncbi:MFS transporter [Aquabacterium sp. A7-Y]|uniref:MFS transporter n=1 Tax=Aquabacterium sp. A7-Y TaxID=1349605 RepID=UPI00223E7D4A|nr:MFS transporter [Aquabacterium sp. A7-Y]MCW7539436.1 MFS transporter [Aquabacterium sp. A7-Y]